MIDPLEALETGAEIVAGAAGAAAEAASEVEPEDVTDAFDLACDIFGGLFD